ncbi:TPA_asm: hypothetical protein vir215_00021 [Ventrumvirus gergoviense]|uniref:Uncharacterized protein n=1 Tax=Caudoviricetes sp. vir215 TaxID=3068354 RepID=A0AA86XLU2_9CAUD|nr:TPA_asm: hypothetical protein vir215_00021 [Caudoviricetes sp. vir215]
MSLDETSAEFKAMKEEWQRRAADVASIDEACALAKEIMALDHDYGTYIHACRISIKAIRDATVVFETAITGSVTHAMETIDKLDVWKSGGRIDKMVEESAGYLPKIGTFEWVLARVRHGAEYHQFRRAGWAKYRRDAVLDMSDPAPAIIDTKYPAYKDAFVRILSASDMTADDWEEVD